MAKLPEQIDAIFEAAETQADYVIGLYRLAFPRWDEIKEVSSGWPMVSNAMAEYLMAKAIAWDIEANVQAMHGGMWMNQGFSSDSNVVGWDIKTDHCEITYEGDD